MNDWVSAFLLQTWPYRSDLVMQSAESCEFCEFCGLDYEECDCVPCEQCGQMDCEHQAEKTNALLSAWGKAIEDLKAKREAEKGVD